MKKWTILWILVLAAALLIAGPGCGAVDSGDEDGDETDGDTEPTDGDDGNNTGGGCSGACTAADTTKCIPKTGGYTLCACTNGTWIPNDCATSCQGLPVSGCADDPEDEFAYAVCLCGSTTDGDDPVDGDDPTDGDDPVDGDDTEPVCGNGVVEQGEACERNADCAANQTCTACQCVGGGAVCGNNVIEQGEQCEDASDCAAGQSCTACQCVGGGGDGVCIAFSTGTGEQLECRGICNPAPNTCGDGFMCLGFAALDQSQHLVIGGGYCMMASGTQQDFNNWLATLPTCNPQDQAACNNGATGVCLTDNQNNSYCFPNCNINGDTCPSGPFPGYEQYGSGQWPCVGYPANDGSTVGLCEPWGNAPTCSAAGESCSPVR